MDTNERREAFETYIRTSLQQRLSRREILQRALSLGLSLGAVNQILAACGAPQVVVQPQPTSAPDPTAVPSLTPLPSPTTTPAPTSTPLPTPTPAPTLTPTPVPPTRFAVIGDFGLAGEPAAAVAEMVAAWQPEFVVTTGDNNYPNGDPATLDQNVGQYYHQFIAPYKGSYGEGADRQRFFPVLGNHDWDSGYPQAYLDYFSLPGNGRYYQFLWGPIAFFMLDSMFAEPDGFQADSKQAQWLAEAMQASTAPWKIVVFHHAPYSSGHHGSSKWMRWSFAEWGAHLVLAGHDHDYERLVVDGVTYLVNGLGGGARYARGETFEETSEIFFNADHGALLIEATATTLMSRFYTRRGEMVDEVILTGGGA